MPGECLAYYWKLKALPSADLQLLFLISCKLFLCGKEVSCHCCTFRHEAVIAIQTSSIFFIHYFIYISFPPEMVPEHVLRGCTKLKNK